MNASDWTIIAIWSLDALLLIAFAMAAKKGKLGG